uniref:Uncharacterized protein n=1 Tax=Triticum urartu TaxID=4572 RepID=A0A8R7Q6S1_TRIUA
SPHSRSPFSIRLAFGALLKEASRPLPSALLGSASARAVALLLQLASARVVSSSFHRTAVRIMEFDERCLKVQDPKFDCLLFGNYLFSAECHSPFILLFIYMCVFCANFFIYISVFPPFTTLFCLLNE